MNLYNQKLLSHRLGSFSKIESSLSALKNACLSNVPFLEIDTRSTKDGKVFVYHDPIIKINKLNKKFCNISSNEIDKFTYTNNEKILSLDETLKHFTDRRYKPQILCIDIKDFGFENSHLELVKKYNLEDNVYFISWIPQTLIKLFEIGSKSSLFLSHINLYRIGFLGSFISKLIANIKFKFSNFVILGKNQFANDLKKYSHGFQHLLLTNILDGKLLNVLTANNGGVSIPVYNLNRSSIRYYRENGLRIATFTENNLKKYQIIAENKDIDIIFSDNAKELFCENNLKECDTW